MFVANRKATDELLQRQTRGTADFRPLPLLSNPHVQTVLGNLMRGPALDGSTSIQRLMLPDGDQLVLYDSVPRRWRRGDPIAVLVHGLGGSHNSTWMIRLARMIGSHVEKSPYVSVSRLGSLLLSRSRVTSRIGRRAKGELR